MRDDGDVYVEPSPAGGYHVKLRSAPRPISHHDTEEEALLQRDAYLGVGRDPFETTATPAPPDGEEVVLRDGSTVRIRPVRPGDKPLFRAGWTRLGEESRRQRFLGEKERLDERDLARFTEVDHHDREAIGALDGRTGEGLGVARFERDPAQPDVATAAVAVVDAWQGRGLGTALLERLVIRAAEEGIRHFRASLLASNPALLAAFERFGAPGSIAEGAGVVSFEVELPVVPRRALGTALKAVAAGDLAQAPWDGGKE